MDEKVDARSIALCFDFAQTSYESYYCENPTTRSSLKCDYSALLLQFEGWSLQGQRCWEARNVKKSGELMGVDLVFLDKKEMSMEASNVEALDEATALRERQIYPSWENMVTNPFMDFLIAGDFKCGSKTGCPYRNHVERCLEDPAMPAFSSGGFAHEITAVGWFGLR
ncbi:hypothetical protein HID58_079515, partial [Brassica napus]